MGKPLLNKNKSKQLSKPDKLAEEIAIEQDEEAAKEYINGINLQHLETRVEARQCLFSTDGKRARPKSLLMQHQQLKK